jgi:hexokinase
LRGSAQLTPGPPPTASCRLAEKEALFGGAVPGLLARHHCFTTAHMAAADEDDSPGLEGVAAVLREALRIERSSQQQRSVVRALPLSPVRQRCTSRA